MIIFNEFHSVLNFYFFSGAMLLESALLDVAPDEALDLNKKKRMMRWDAKKRKFVKVSFF